MPLEIHDAELFGLTESSATLCFRVEDASGPVDAPVEVLLDGSPRARCDGGAGTRTLRVEGLEPGRRYSLELRAEGGSVAEPGRYLPADFETQAAPVASPVAELATLNDLHFGEVRVGGTLLENGDYGPDAPGFPSVRADATEVPYWRFMNEDAVAEINAAGVAATIIKGDIADRGRPEQFAAAADCFAKLAMPWHSDVTVNAIGGASPCLMRPAAWHARTESRRAPNAASPAGATSGSCRSRTDPNISG